MKKLIALLILISSLSFSQERRYYFDYRENRTLTGWEKIETSGEVIIYEDRYNRTFTIVTQNRSEHLYVKSKLLFVRQDTLLYTLVDAHHNECSLRIVAKDSLGTLDLYYYSDRKEEKYYKLLLKKCE
jgi:hypothetical protein